eukprot:10895414-Lingulodinium_polyedra.AAC.1
MPFLPCPPAPSTSQPRPRSTICACAAPRSTHQLPGAGMEFARAACLCSIYTCVCTQPRAGL